MKPRTKSVTAGISNSVLCKENVAQKELCIRQPCQTTKFTLATQVALSRNDSTATNPAFKMSVTKIAPPFRPTFGKIKSLQQTSIGQLS